MVYEIVLKHRISSNRTTRGFYCFVRVQGPATIGGGGGYDRGNMVTFSAQEIAKYGKLDTPYCLQQRWWRWFLALLRRL